MFDQSALCDPRAIEEPSSVHPQTTKPIGFKLSPNLRLWVNNMKTVCRHLRLSLFYLLNSPHYRADNVEKQ